MKRIDSQLQRLLRAAAAAPARAAEEPVKVRGAAWLLQQRERTLAAEESEAGARSMLQGGLAVACALLLLTCALSAWQLRQVKQDVFGVSVSALTHVSTP